MKLTFDVMNIEKLSIFNWTVAVFAILYTIQNIHIRSTLVIQSDLVM